MRATDFEKELSANKELMKLTTGKEDGESSGSDSAPSEDNLGEEEMAQVVPMKPKPAAPAQQKDKPKVAALAKKPTLLMPPGNDKKKAPSSPQVKTREPLKDGMTIAQRQAMQGRKPGMFNFEKKYRMRKPDMKDAAT